MFRSRLIGGGLLGIFLSACGPTRYITIVHERAQHALDEAAAAQAATLAPYEFTLAQANLERSRELAGYSRWGDSLALGRKATSYADKARAIAIEQALKPKEHD